MSGRNRVVESSSLERRRNGGIYYSAGASLFFLSVTLYLARTRLALPSLLPLRLAFSSFLFLFPISSTRASLHPFSRYLLFVWLQNWELRINKTISPVLPFKIASLLKKILSRTANSNVNRLGKRIYIYSLFLHSFFTILLSSFPFVEFPQYFFRLFLCFTVSNVNFVTF